MLIAGCPPQNKGNFTNTHLIPENHHGWLVVREMAGT